MHKRGNNSTLFEKFGIKSKKLLLKPFMRLIEPLITKNLFC
jgi:hypothetical protein